MIALYKQVYSLDSSSLSSVFSHWAGPWQLVQLISSFSPVSPFISLGVARNLFGTLWCLLALVCLSSPHHREGGEERRRKGGESDETGVCYFNFVPYFPEILVF